MTERRDVSHDIEHARAFWADVSGLPPEDLIFAPPPPRWKQSLRARLARLPWLDRCFGPPTRPAMPIPVNLAPWTNIHLPGLRDSGTASPLARLHDLWLWDLSHPDTRHETLEWHRQKRRNSALVWRLRKLRTALRGHAPGTPDWMPGEPSP